MSLLVSFLLVVGMIGYSVQDAYNKRQEFFLKVTEQIMKCRTQLPQNTTTERLDALCGTIPDVKDFRL